jgi:serine protease Do
VQTELRSVDQFNDLLAKQGKGAPITLLVRRGDSQTFVTIRGMPDK